MKQEILEDKGICKRCRRCNQLLPIEAFYKSKKRIDSYCKECRADNSRVVRKTRNNSPSGGTARLRPLIMQQSSSDIRIKMIKDAKLMVAKSVERKRKREIERQYQHALLMEELMQSKS